jgi:hypothetical protein
MAREKNSMNFAQKETLIESFKGRHKKTPQALHNKKQ